MTNYDKTSPKTEVASDSIVEENLFTRRTDVKMFLNGALAVARGAYEAGVGLVTTYPGSPITETFEALDCPENPDHPHCHLSINEHIAFHQAMGFSLTGGRSMVTMKHVGFNVAADPAHYIGYTGVRGGMVVLVGTDPGATCSTGEYDFRFYALHTHLPLLEPSNGQEILEMTKSAFRWSEEDQTPYIIAIPSGACYGVEDIIPGAVEAPRREGRFLNSPDYTNVGRRAVINHTKLLEKVRKIDEKTFDRGLVKFYGTGKKAAIFTSGYHLGRVIEALEILGIKDDVRIACFLQTYPLPIAKLEGFLAEIDQILFIEDLGGFLETSASRALLSFSRKFYISGKDFFPPTGELSILKVIQGLDSFFGISWNFPSNPIELPEREGTFCPGCMYRPFFYALTEFLSPDDVLGGDIGCSSLPPHFSSWLTCMNSGTAISSGVTLALNGQAKVVSLIGDSTLLHSGLQTIIECASQDSDQICFVLNNHWTAMTGHQVNPSTPSTAMGNPRPHLEIESLLESCGVKRIWKADPTHLTAFKKFLKKIFQEKGFRVVIIDRECNLQVKRRKAKKGWTPTFQIEPERCHECGLCYEKFCCPAIIKTENDHFQIDSSLCSNCGVCSELCPNGAVVGVQIFNSSSKDQL
ncbi:MAG: indolepyruvate ferredoxin oxidoreductase subunit alpha [Candidatus Riflebacteria bacterium]|nr:indolepyruvate ferredoxin oxidoreductase subunit alpha [Candidatus Riflebacteria bacterium]